ncbi:hypothetical protein TWF481_000412 [Arthrobotrys musiformis]|uniref:MaoC-like domain-containing protein n=1 Tax=Arthrobotrys musiformis TaxID=47236 RepID=A0AAV9WPH9_9PEZI
MVLPSLLLRPGSRLIIHTRLPSRPSISPLISRPFTTTLTRSLRTLEELKRDLKPQPPTEEEVSAAKEAVKRLPQEAHDLLSRKFPLVHEFISPAHSNLLTLSLQPYLNFSDIIKPEPGDEKAPHNPFTVKGMLPIYGTLLPPGYHFAFFNGYTYEEDLSQDGYISIQSPGGPWTRRMWAGGKLTFNKMPDKRDRGNDKGARRGRPLHIGRRGYCHETVEDVQMKGEPGSPNEMMFVYLKRKIWATGFIVKEPTKSPKILEVEDVDEDKVILPDEEVPLIEQRILVYMRQKPVEAIKSAEEAAKPKEQEDPTSEITKEMAPTSKISSRAAKAEFSHTLTPSQQLLFRYSALTFNAHKIHFDTEYTKNVEGHRDLLVHGPLTITFLLEFFRNQILGLEKQWRVCDFQYRNIAPVYVNEKLHLYGRYLPDAPVPIQEQDDYNPRDRLIPMYDEMDTIRKELQRLGLMRFESGADVEDHKARKKELRRMLSMLKKEVEKLEKFNLKPKRIIDYRNYELWAENDRGQVVVKGTALIEDLPAKVELTPEQQWKKYQSEMVRNKKMMQKQQLRAHKDMVRKRRRERKARLRTQQMEREALRREEKEKVWKDVREAIMRGELPQDYQPDFSAVEDKIRELEAKHKQEQDEMLHESYEAEPRPGYRDDESQWKLEVDERYESYDEEDLGEEYENEDDDDDDDDSDDDDESGEEENWDDSEDYREERREEEYDDEDIDRRK